MREIMTAVLGLAGAASGQSTWTWQAEVSDPVIEPGDQVTVALSVAMTADAPFVALSAAIFDVLNAGGGEHGTLVTWKVENNLDELNSDIITNDGVNIFNVNVGQLNVFGPFTSDNPIHVLTYWWEAETPGEVSYDTVTDAAVMWVGDDKESATGLDADVVFEASWGWSVVECEADVNGDGALDVLDFVAFQLAWQAGEPVADCDLSGSFDVLDFVCFQQAFVAGCD